MASTDLDLSTAFRSWISRLVSQGQSIFFLIKF